MAIYDDAILRNARGIGVVNNTPAQPQSSVSGLLGGAQNFLTSLGGVASAWDQLQTGLNPVTGQEYDLTAPGVTTTTGSDVRSDVTAPLIPGTVADAQSIYAAGRPELNPLLTGYYNETAGLLDPARTEQLATRAATAAGTPFSSSFGSARHQAAANRAASDAILDRETQARAELGRAGQAYQDWQTGADFDWLDRYRQSAGIAGGPTTQTTVTAPSGADLYQAELGRQLIQSNIGSLGGGVTAPGQNPYGSGLTGQIGQWSNTLGNVSNLVSAGAGLWDTVSGFFAEGGEVMPEGNRKRASSWDDVL